ncbi:MAG: isopentenyl-diphosphate delta-isomerase [Aestuariivita sp.]|nr:isopentenyl-diphosphate delta-isomerase [Aestuariivita sp.]|tara:strand:- start:88 stop:630 length:543 start_codon:yes stop_codon:yes gene_type:complete
MTVNIPAWVNGKIQPVEKLDAHLKGLKHKAISVFMVCGQEVLIQKRALGKYHTPGLWANTCCTHPNWEEDAKICAIRRMDEELGLKNTLPVYRDTIEYRADVGGGLIEHEIVELFVIQVEQKPILDLNPEEVMDVRWVDYHALQTEVSRSPEKFTPWVRIYIKDHASKIFNEDLLRSSVA